MLRPRRRRVIPSWPPLTAMDRPPKTLIVLAVVIWIVIVAMAFTCPMI